MKLVSHSNLIYDDNKTIKQLCHYCAFEVLKTSQDEYTLHFSLISLLVQVKCQVCDNTIAYDRCSTNNACGCFLMVGAQNVGVCAFLWKFCSQLVSCGSSQDCSVKDHICVHHHRCSNDPVCYPLSMMNENICPPASTSK